MYLSDTEGAESRVDPTAQSKSDVSATGRVIVKLFGLQSGMNMKNKVGMVFNEPTHSITSDINQPQAPKQNRYC